MTAARQDVERSEQVRALVRAQVLGPTMAIMATDLRSFGWIPETFQVIPGVARPPAK
ncbi:hypothetical protein FHX52_0015 [Humibacillus xanthopallidus]|uniref:Uncharacterized protein n=1 Tax=Humibacillus xanthopallidus TaxID=412689 RepID=A0A543PS74_9MICO|nr:hypothetical protein [Humibacillus xanthopallidus]TQN46912.1 hypothetical protein FHX52_3644 [Humibacillus xanthopallidus]TQN46914.1 hypothetical protein FHX52_0003 [Humibacillus xanthopallidus]TQN46926.1 hypothetical protein FHX52_0015 [Humibacillus xanthopallidus]